MSYQRHQRVESLIREELNKILLKEAEFDGALVTVTAVAVQKDLDYANISISVIPVEKNEEVLKLLEANRRRLQHLLYEKIHIKPMPEIRFKSDLGMEKAAEMERAFLEIEKEKENS